jgi:hypothetical protein
MKIQSIEEDSSSSSSLPQFQRKTSEKLNEGPESIPNIFVEGFRFQF